jgi:transcriptional regulator with GAF, ATPase, and Fis domain
MLFVLSAETRLILTPDEAGNESAEKSKLDAAYAQLVEYARDLRTLMDLRAAAEPPPAPIEGGVRIVGESPAIKVAVDLCRKVAGSPTTVLLLGQTGTGKELAARMIHEMSPRHSGPFVAVNCAALPEGLAESELFGHEKGAFTGANQRRAGQFEMAAGGTLFLDEVGELDLNLQSKLLRVLEEQQFRRVGGTEVVKLDVRLIAATNRDFEKDLASGRFRSDLFYRLHVFPILMPSVAQRSGDVPLLAEHLLGQVSRRLGKTPAGFEPEAMELLTSYSWPGNVRELRNVIERCVVLADGGPIKAEHLPANIRASGATPDIHTVSLSPLHRGERDMVLRALNENHWNKSAAARQLGVTWDILRSRIKKYKLVKPAVMDDVKRE